MLDPFQTPRPSPRATLIFGALVVAVLGIAAWVTQQPLENDYVAQARALLAGRWEGGALPPAPLLLTTPFVALFGGLNPLVITLLLTPLNIWLLFRLLNRIGIMPEKVLWVGAAFFLGTAYGLAVRDSMRADSFGHIIAITFVLLALDQAYGRGSPLLTGLWLALAFLSRPLTILAAPFVVVALLSQIPGSAKQLWRAIGVFAAMLALGVALYWLYLWVRPAGPNTSALEQHGLYALPFVSPFLIAAGFAKWGRRSMTALWFSAGMIVLNLLWTLSGNIFQLRPSQHALDMLPFLLIPVGIAFNQAQSRAWLIWRILIAVSIGFSALAFLGQSIA